MTNEIIANSNEQVLERHLILPIKMPIRTLFRKVKIDPFIFFKTLAKGTGSYASNRHWNLPADAIEGLQAIEIDPLDESERAWLLIYKAMLRGATELVHPSISLLNPDESTKDALVNSLDAILMERQVTIDSSFFQNPQNLDILKDFQELIFLWLIGWGLEENRAQTVVQRLPIFFVSALHEEWRENSSDYTAVIAAFNTPFIAATEHLLAWERYYAILRKQVQEAMFEETFSLEQIYIPLRAYYEEANPIMTNEEREEQDSQGRKIFRIVVPLQETLNAWLDKKDPEEALRVVSGGPGSGKSSFAKMWAASLTKQNSDLRVLYIPLHNFNLKDSLEDAVGDFVRQTSLFDQNPFDVVEGEKRLLLIFDGLDEIAQRGRASTELARNFVVEVSENLSRRNQFSCCVQALITGRELVVQSNATRFRREKQVLHTLPYTIEDSQEKTIKRGGQYKDDLNILQEDQRDLWWQKYGAAIGQPFVGIPKPLRRKDMEDLTAQPLLNYLVALSYQRGELDFTAADINLNQIYGDLLVGVHKRDYEGKRNVHVSALSSHEFGRVLEEIALAVWHGNGRTATVEEIEEHCDRSGSSILIKKLEESAKSGVTRLLTAFYFREEGFNATGERTFEFTHKTFGEYLTAKRIARGMEKMLKELKDRRESYDEGWDERRALQEWVEVCGPTELDQYVVAFLHREIELKNQQTLKDWQIEICGLISMLLRVGLPLELVEGSLSFKEMLRQSRNAEEALLVLHCLCASAVENPTPSQIKWTGMTSALGWVKRLQGDKISGKSLTSSSLAFICFDSQSLTACDFFDANLKGSSFTHASLYMANLNVADMTFTNLNYADLSFADLTNADLREADLREADFTEAILVDANLAYTDVTGADFTGARLAGAKVLDSNFNKDSFRDATFVRGDPTEIDSIRENLCGVDLTGVSLMGSNLANADLTNADLRGADLRGANLNGAIFDLSDLHEAIIDSTKGLLTEKSELSGDEDEV